MDWVTISSSLLFSMNYVINFEQLKKENFYNKVRLSDYTAENYLKDVEVVRKDYRALFEEYKNHSNVVFLVDPPYLSTDCSTYSRPDYWKLSDYLNVLTFKFLFKVKTRLKKSTLFQSEVNYKN